MAVSAFFSLRRGLAREALSLITWLASLWIALRFAQAVGVYMPEAVEAPSLRIAIAFVVLLLAGLIVGSLLIRLMAELVDLTGLTATDRVLGMVFGAARGAAIVVVLVFLLGMTPVTRDAWWKASLVIAYAQPAVRTLAAWLPKDLRETVFGAGNRFLDQVREQAEAAADLPKNKPVEAR